MCCKRKGLITLFKALPHDKGKQNEKEFSQLTFLIPTLPLLLECLVVTWHPSGRKLHWQHHLTVSPLLKHQYRAAYGERKTSTRRKTKIKRKTRIKRKRRPETDSHGRS